MRQKISNHYPRLTGVTKHIHTLSLLGSEMQEEAFGKRLLDKHTLVTKNDRTSCNNDVPNHDYGTKIIYSR
jgi:hypothetical protein